VFKNYIQTQAREVLCATGISGHKVLRLMQPPQLQNITMLRLLVTVHKVEMVLVYPWDEKI